MVTLAALQPPPLQALSSLTHGDGVLPIFVMVTLAALPTPCSDRASPGWPHALLLVIGVAALGRLAHVYWTIIPPSVPPSGSRNPLYYN